MEERHQRDRVFNRTARNAPRPEGRGGDIRIGRHPTFDVTACDAAVAQWPTGARCSLHPPPSFEWLAPATEDAERPRALTDVVHVL